MRIGIRPEEEWEVNLIFLGSIGRGALVSVGVCISEILVAFLVLSGLALDGLIERPMLSKIQFYFHFLGKAS